MPSGIKSNLDVPKAKSGGRPRSQIMRETINAVFYLVKAGCTWRMLPHDLPKWQTVYYYFLSWSADGTWEKIHDFLRAEVRIKAGRKIEQACGDCRYPVCQDYRPSY